MRLYYDNEFNILKDIHELEKSECLIISDDIGTENYFSTASIIDDIISDSGFVKWKDNTKSKFPPDLINEEDSLMMEVMRVDDHSPDGKKNPVLAKQRKMSEKIRPLLEQFPKDVRIIINAVTDLPTEKDHNYKFYYSSFQRTIRKHLSKLSTYRKNHPNKKMIFLVFDETTGNYFEKAFVQENQLIGRPHIPFFDKRFLNEFIDSTIDYLMWYIPYNHSETMGAQISLPRLTIIDIKNARNGVMLQKYEYDENKMISSEK